MSPKKSSTTGSWGYRDSSAWEPGLGPGMKGRTGEVRTTGSIAYELAMTACGVLQYAVIGGPRMWDMAAGALAVSEAGGAVMTRLRGQKKWGQMDSLVPSWNDRPPTLKELRQWVAPLVAGKPARGPSGR